MSFTEADGSQLEHHKDLEEQQSVTSTVPLPEKEQNDPDSDSDIEW